MEGLSGTETAVRAGAAEEEAFGPGNGQREAKDEGGRRQEKIQVGRMGGLSQVGRTLEQEGVGQT